MRLARVERGQGPLQPILFGAIRVMSGHRAPDVVRTLQYRPDVFGRAFSAWTQAVMRGPSPWTVGERELFAAFTSKVNQCPF